jgi:hypothetical protein
MHKYTKDSIGRHKTLSKNATRQQRQWDSTNTINTIEVKYGFQMAKFNNYIGHNGSLPGFTNYALCNIPSKTTIIIMINTKDINNEILSFSTLVKLVLELFPGW